MIQVKEINTKITKRITSVTETDNRSNNDTTKASNGLSQQITLFIGKITQTGRVHIIYNITSTQEQ